MTLYLPNTLSMEIQASSEYTATEHSSVHSLMNRTASLSGTSNSHQHASDAISTTTAQSQHDHHYPTITQFEDRDAIQHSPTDMHHSLPHLSPSLHLSIYPTEIQQDDLPSTFPKSLGQPTNRNNQVQHQTTNGPLQLQSQIRQNSRNRSFSPTRKNTTDQNASQSLQPLPMSPPPTLAPPSKPRSQSTTASYSTDEPQPFTRLQDWVRAPSTEERMRCGYPRWENEEEGGMNLKIQMFHQHLE